MIHLAFIRLREQLEDFLRKLLLSRREALRPIRVQHRGGAAETPLQRARRLVLASQILPPLRGDGRTETRQRGQNRGRWWLPLRPGEN